VRIPICLGLKHYYWAPSKVEGLCSDARGTQPGGVAQWLEQMWPEVLNLTKSQR